MRFTENYLEYVEEFTDAPKVFHSRLALLILSTIVHNKIWLCQGDKKLFPNLWMLLLAPSSFYRKSYSLGIAERMIREIDPSLIYPSDFSREGLLKKMKEKAQGIIMSYEFQSLMGLLSRDFMAGAKSTLTELYDCPNDFRGTRKMEEDSIIYSPFLNIGSASTLEWFCDSLKESDMAGGFLARFFIVQSYPKHKIIAWQQRDNRMKRDQLINHLHQVNSLSGEMKIAEDAIDYYTQWYSEFERKHRDESSALTPFYARLTEYAKKFSVLHAVDRVPPLLYINREDMKLSCSISENCADEISQMIKQDMVFSNYQKDRRKVEMFLKNARGQKRSRQELCVATRIRKRFLDEIVAELAEADIIGRETVEKPDPSGTKYVTFYWWKNGTPD